jgi:hypothetical protein
MQRFPPQLGGKTADAANTDPTTSICVQGVHGSTSQFYTRHQIQASLNFMGCKPAHSAEITGAAVQTDE